jgi:methylmalonyl-CoA mutase N-terminal domain/subunit
MKETFGAKQQRSWLMRFHTQTAGATLTAQQPEVNIVRVALQALAAILGGTQSLHTNSMDEALALPSEKAVNIALRTQQVIAHETGVANTIDPLGGSFYLEWLTNEMEKRTYAMFQEIESLGGVIKAIEAGYFQREIAESAFRYQREIDEQRRVIVGVNDYTVDAPLTIPILEFDPDGERRQIARLQDLRRSRDNERVGVTLNALRDAARGTQNMMPFILAAVKAYATLQEITDVLRGVFGVYQEPVIV